MSSPSLSTYAAGANSGRVVRPHLFAVTATTAAVIGDTQSLCVRKLIVKNTHDTLNLYLYTVLGGSTVYETITPGGSHVVEPGGGARFWTNEVGLIAEDGVGPITANCWAWL